MEAPKVRQVVSGWGDDEWSGILDRCPYLIAVLARAAHVSEEELEAKRPRALRALQVAARRRPGLAEVVAQVLTERIRSKSATSTGSS